ncbi:hypothetical protein J4219_01245 [Candidatus Woesearchaeota archaeon]|nr:hypothetical protein [Candidatus Woesearchaeota archaeon]
MNLPTELSATSVREGHWKISNLVGDTFKNEGNVLYRNKLWCSMLITKEEAISLILAFSKDHKISSKTKLNKLLARLNLFMIPIDVDFNLNKYGSYNSELELATTPFYETYTYPWQGANWSGLRLVPQGELLAEKVINTKIKKILPEEDITKLKKTIYSLSELGAGQISEEEHKDLLVDPDERHKLQQRINIVHIELLDLNSEAKKISDENPTDVRFAALVEYCYYLSKYLKEKAFKNLEETEYDFEANMFNYYFMYILAKEVVPFLKKQIQEERKDIIRINRYYQYFVNVARTRYSFSLDNPDLKSLIS